MRITYIHQHFNLPSEGGGSRPYEFARRMVAKGHEVTMICGRAEALDTVFDGVHIRRLPVPYRNSMNVPQRLLSFARFMVSASIVASRTKADVIFASSTPLTVAVPAIVAKIAQGAPMVFEVRDLWPALPIELGYLRNPLAIAMARFLERIAYKSATSIVALSPGMRDGILEVDSTKKVITIPNACDFETFAHTEFDKRTIRADKGWSDDEIVVVYAGGFGPVYEINWSVRLAGLLKEDNIRFVLIGEGASSEEACTLARELGLNSEELLPGRKSRAEVAAYYAAADLVLSTVKHSPGLEAASINKVFDGMAADKPILVNHDGWLRDKVIGASAGWQLDRDITVAARQLREIASNPSALVEAGLNSGQIGRRYFERNQLFEQLMDELRLASIRKTSKNRRL